MPKILKMSSHGLSTLFNIASSTSSVFFQDVQKTDYDFSGPFAYLKRHLSYFVKIAFFDARVAENDFAWHFDSLKHRFIDFTKVVF
jgi:hypothetical protein